MEYSILWYRDMTLHSYKPKTAFLNAFANLKVKLTDHHRPGHFGLILLDDTDKIEEAKQIVRAAVRNQEKILIVLFDEKIYVPNVIWDFLSEGASRVYDFHNVPLIHRVIEEQLGRWQSIESLLKTDFVKEYLTGESVVWKNTLREMIEVSVFTQSSVLILGESGTGKEMLSRLIHHFDTRSSKGNLVLVDCTTIAPELSGSEFFGHEKGAFTGANNSRDGAFSMANEGTLFLDEIGELSARLQSELLRVIQEGLYKPIGSNFWKRSTFRLVGATNRMLSEEVTNGNFRLDLYHRLSSWVCKVPSLSERKEDISLLAQRFLSKYFIKRDIPEIHESVIEYLSNRNYKGNVRELQQLVQRIACLHVGKGPITLNDIPVMDRPILPPREHMNSEQPGYNEYENAIQNVLNKGMNLKEIRDLTMQTAIDLAIRCERGRVNMAANRLGITARAIQLFKQKKLT